MDKTVQSYLNEYISLIGKGKFVLLGGNTFMDGTNPNLDRIVEAINKYTTTDGVTAEGIFESRLKNKAEVEIKKTDGTIEVAKGSATDAQYAAFVAEWKSIQEPLVKALIAQFDIVEKAKGAAPAGAPGLFGGLTPAELAIGLNPLKKAGDVAAVLAAVAKKLHLLVEEFNKADMNFTKDMMNGNLDELVAQMTEYLNRYNADSKERDRRRDDIIGYLTITDCGEMGSDADRFRDDVIGYATIYDQNQ
jgi:hypothetical protein